MFTSSRMTTVSADDYTLVEILMALGMLSVAIMAVTYALTFLWTKAHLLESKTSNRLDLAVLEKFLFKDLTDSGPSLGNIRKFYISKETNTTNNFFEIFASTPLARIAKGNRTRRYTLDAKEGGGFIEF